MTVERTAIPVDAQQCQPSHTIHEAQREIRGSSATVPLLSDDEAQYRHLETSSNQCDASDFGKIGASSSTAVSFNTQFNTTTEATRQRDVDQTRIGEMSSTCTRIEPPKSGSQTLQRVQTTEKADSPSSTQHRARSTSKKQSQARKPANSNRKQTSLKTRRTIPKEMQAQWRVGAAPSVALSLSREESQVSKVLSQAQAFHTTMFDSIWGPHVYANQFVFDLDNRVEVFRDSSVTAACLVAVGKSPSAQAILDRVLPGMDELLRNPPPALYLILAEHSLGLVKTPNNALRDQIVQYMAGRALEILGPEHPITELLTTRLPQSRKESLGDQLWKVVLPILAQSFGSDHYQSSTQVFCQARNMASCGRPEEAIIILEGQIARWSQLYGNNSLIVCYSKIELANILVAAGVSLKAEFVVSDALRTTDMIHAAELRDEDCNASEKRHRKSSIAFPRVAALRTLGKLHSLRGNLGAATYYYSQAVEIGMPSLGETSASVELALSDLKLARSSEQQQNQQSFTTADLSNLTYIVPSPVC